MMFLPGPWRKDAACGGMPSEVFFPERGQTTEAAKKVCRRCPVRLECLEFALSTHERHGVWGGMALRERRRYQLLRSTLER